MAHTVAALAMPGVVAFDLSTAAQVFGMPGEHEYEFAVATPTSGAVPTSTGFSVSGVDGLDAVVRADTVVIPGHRPYDISDGDVVAALREAHERGARLVSICVGAFLLARTGLLDGLSATTHWQDAAELQRRHPAVQVEPDVLYIDHGRIATSAGVASGIDLCLHLVRQDVGASAAHRIARRMVVPPHRDGGQAQFVDPGTRLARGGELIDAVMNWAVRHLDQPLGTAELARRANLSERQLTRRFLAETGVSPFQWLLHQRTLRAMELLEGTDLSLETVAARSGFGTASTLRRRFRDALETTPSAYRATFHRGGTR
ncbi:MULTISPECIES: GlxA family transcriptional regulator [Brachybacterium]|uniref:GlxA family transcriptional regulator n=1 Tax=Brachybacterium TaxID=43668 RepID=UPI0006B46AA3|nr:MULTISPECIES: helix-turn-helix domain-containing protein [Brachybacterium]